MAESGGLSGPDLEKDGVLAEELADGALIEGHFAGQSVLLARRGEAIHAIGARCTHYGGPLAEGLLTDGVVRCPWHHACFDLKSGEAVAAPALDPVPCFRTEQRNGRIFVTAKLEREPKRRLELSRPKGLVVLGAGAAGAAAVVTLRKRGYAGKIALVDREDSGPVDRPNLSKDYLAGKAPEEWLPLRPREFYGEEDVELHLGSAAVAIDGKRRQLTLESGATLEYDALLYALGAEPIRLSLPGGNLPHVHLLRSLADCRSIIARAGRARRAVVIGASFIGLEVAASLRARELEVDVVAPERVPLEKVLGEVGSLVQRVHESQGVRFHLGLEPAAITEHAVTLDDGSELAADLVVMGVGVRPSTALAEGAGIAVDGGVLTDACLRTNLPGVFAAGDVARYETAEGERRRVEHWVHAERQGAVAAENMLGERTTFRSVPFFWTTQYDLTLCYVGWAQSWDTLQIAGSLEERDATIAYRSGGAIRAVATIGRDAISLRAEQAMERSDSAALEALLER